MVRISRARHHQCLYTRRPVNNHNLIPIGGMHSVHSICWVPWRCNICRELTKTFPKRRRGLRRLGELPCLGPGSLADHVYISSWHSSNGRTRSQTCSWLIAEAHQEDARSERCPSRKRTQSGSILGASYFPAAWHTQWLRQIVSKAILVGRVDLDICKVQVVHIMFILQTWASPFAPCLEYSLRTILVR